MYMYVYMCGTFTNNLSKLMIISKLHRMTLYNLKQYKH